jgi:hypothetical protein
MKRKSLYVALAMAMISGTGYAQSKCATDEVNRHYQKLNPQTAEFERQMNESIAAFIASRGNSGMAAKTTATRSDTDYYDIPVAIHIIHNYGAEFLKDSNVYAMINHLNKFYNKQSPLNNIVEPFKKYIGNAKIRFHLATIDPQGNPTKGITRRLSYLTYGGDEQAKMDQWNPRSYFNIWFENRIGRSPASGTILAYATFPSTGESFPFTDGVISGYLYVNDENTIEHEAGHYFQLHHPWNSSGADVGVACGDDEVDDTPPTKGHFSVCNLYDTVCATNYYKVYPRASGIVDSFVNYPDTTNTQNIMDYSSCPQSMLTIGQVWRMRGALNSNIGGRNNLWDSTNLVMTGALAPSPDLKPITDWCSKLTTNQNSSLTYFTFPDVPLYFTNKSWRDTIISTSWTFTNGANIPSVTHTAYSAMNNAFANKFSEPGWVTVTLAAEGNNSGTTTTTYPNAVFVADNNAVKAIDGYFQEFSTDGDRDKWPMFNYYNNDFKWKHANVGMYDNASLMYQGFDKRIGVAQLTGTPRGDFDDLYSVPFDLTGFDSKPCNLNYFYSGASRTSSSEHINDTLFIDYSVDKKHQWTNLRKLTKGDLCNQGVYSTEFTPTWAGHWSPMTINLPEAARTPYTVFRFRYKPGTFKGSNSSSGNNFFMDRISIAPWPAEVTDVMMGNQNVKVLPNPTSGDAYVVVKAENNSKVEIVVSDITGKVVYTTNELIKGGGSRILIPSNAIATKGLYIVQTTTGAQVNTQKLVVY